MVKQDEVMTAGILWMEALSPASNKMVHYVLVPYIKGFFLECILMKHVQTLYDLPGSVKTFLRQSPV